MKLFVFIVFAIVFFISTTGIAMPADSTNFYLSIKTFDLGKLWRSDSLQVLENERYPNGKLIFEAQTTDKFPEPYGFIGLDFQRFYIHYLTVKKDTGNAYRYMVTGKTKVKDSIRNFQGTITVVKAKLSKEPTAMLVPRPDKKNNEVLFKQGVVYCDIKFTEDTSRPASGTITGRLATKFYLDSSQHMFYDNLNNISDSYANNQFIGLWKKNKTDSVKRCNWGDYRIPLCGDLDQGTGGFYPADKYLMNGWQNYRDAYSIGNDAVKTTRAINGENIKWWKY